MLEIAFAAARSCQYRFVGEGAANVVFEILHQPEPDAELEPLFPGGLDGAASWPLSPTLTLCHEGQTDI